MSGLFSAPRPVAPPPPLTISIAQLELRAMRCAATELARQLAPILGVSEADVFDQLCTVPDNMLSLLTSPEGWSALAGYVASQFGLAAPAYGPTVH